VEAGQQLCYRRQRLVGLRPDRERRHGHVTGDEHQPLSPIGGDAHRLGHAVEAGRSDIPEQGVDQLGVRVRWPQHVVAFPDN